MSAIKLDVNPGALNPSGTADGYPTTWTQFTLKLSGLASPTDGRIGFRYYLPNNVTDGTVVGIDTFSYTTVPEPSQLALLALGSLALIVMRPSACHLLRAASLIFFRSRPFSVPSPTHQRDFHRPAPIAGQFKCLHRVG